MFQYGLSWVQIKGCLCRGGEVRDDPLEDGGLGRAEPLVGVRSEQDREAYG